jgi:NAD-dependent SIR2 family protein deacetylase
MAGMSKILDPDSITIAAELVARAGALVIATGAGMGVDSGLPDFRGDEGFWRAYPALGARGLDFMSIASARSFETAPRLAWGFYGHRLAMYRQTTPHAGFAILRRWAQDFGLPATVFTSNVDGQFQRAGYRGLQIHECHGSIHWMQCTRPCTPDIWSADDLEVTIDSASCEWVGDLPACPSCGAVARPNILMFHDGRWNEDRTEEQLLQQELWFRQVQRPVVIEIGAGVDITTVRHFSQTVHRIHGGRIVRINPLDHAVPADRGVGLRGGGLAGLQAIDAALRGQRPPPV